MTLSGVAIDQKLRRRTAYRTAVVVLHVILAMIVGLTCVAEFYHPRIVVVPPSRPIPALGPIFTALPLMWPYALSAAYSTPQVTSKHRDFWVLAIALIACTAGVIYLLIKGQSDAELTYWELWWFSLGLAGIFLFIGNFTLDGID